MIINKTNGADVFAMSKITNVPIKHYCGGCIIFVYQ